MLVRYVTKERLLIRPSMSNPKDGKHASKAHAKRACPKPSMTGFISCGTFSAGPKVTREQSRELNSAARASDPLQELTSDLMLMPE